MKKNNKALSIIIAMGLTLIMALLTVYILEYIIPFAKNTKGVEQSVGAYYKADSAIEDALYAMKENSNTPDYEKHKNFNTSSKIDYSIKMTSSGNTLPPSGQGNSDFDKNFNIIKIGEPIQIEIGYNKIDLNNFSFYFQVPNFDGISSTTEQLLLKDSNGQDIKYINWQISSKTNTLNSSGSQLTANDIKGNPKNIKNLKGRDLNDNGPDINQFYINNCTGTNSGCILKMSIINKLKLDNDENIPYIEWKLESGNNIPLRYRIIETEGKFFGFKKFLKVKIPQNTSNQAFDFTVFQ